MEIRCSLLPLPPEGTDKPKYERHEWVSGTVISRGEFANTQEVSYCSFLCLLVLNHLNHLNVENQMKLNNGYLVNFIHPEDKTQVYRSFLPTLDEIRLPSSLLNAAATRSDRDTTPSMVPDMSDDIILVENRNLSRFQVELAAKSDANVVPVVTVGSNEHKVLVDHEQVAGCLEYLSELKKGASKSIYFIKTSY